MLESITVITLLLSALDRIDLQAVFDYYPSVVRIPSGNQLRVWTCTNDANMDGIYLTVFNTDHPTSTAHIASVLPI